MHAAEPPNRLAFTWTFDGDPSNQQMIELEFTERDGVTTVLFVNSDISEDGAAGLSIRGLVNLARMRWRGFWRPSREGTTWNLSI